MNRFRKQFYGLSEIVAEFEKNPAFDDRVEALKFFNANSGGKLRDILWMLNNAPYTKVFGEFGNDIESFKRCDVKDHGVLERTWENSVVELMYVSDSNITKVNIGYENLMYILQDLQPDDAEIIIKVLKGEAISEFLNNAVIEAVFPGLVPKKTSEVETSDEPTSPSGE